MYARYTCYRPSRNSSRPRYCGASCVRQPNNTKIGANCENGSFAQWPVGGRALCIRRSCTVVFRGPIRFARVRPNRVTIAERYVSLRKKTYRNRQLRLLATYLFSASVSRKFRQFFRRLHHHHHRRFFIDIIFVCFVNGSTRLVISPPSPSFFFVVKYRVVS